MAFEWIGHVGSTLAKLAPAPLLACGLATSILIFSSEPLAQTLGVDGFRADHRSELGGAFILSWSYLAAHLIWWFKKLATNSWRTYRDRSTRKKQLHDLTHEEKGYLAPYVIDGVNTQYFAMEDGVAGGLAAKNIIYRSSSVFNMLDGIPYNIQPWAKDYLLTRIELLQGAVRPQRNDSWRI